MNIKLDILSFLLLISVGQLLSACLLTVFRSKDRQANLYFLGFLLCVIALQAEFFLIDTELIRSVPALLSVTPIALLIMGPLLWVHTLRLFNDQFNKLQLVHFLPFVWVLISKLPYWFSPVDSKREKIEAFYFSLSSGDNPIGLSSILYEVHPIIYLIVSVVLIFWKGKGLEKKSRKFAVRQGLLLSYFILVFCFYSFGAWLMNHQVFVQLTLVLLVTIGTLVLYHVATEGTFYLSLKDRRGYLKRLFEQVKLQLMERNLLAEKNPLEQILQVNQFSAADLRGALREAGFNHSQEFINHMRVQEAKKLLLSDMDRFTIEGIGSHVGFQSKTTFFRAFKKMEGCTPLQFTQANAN